MKRRMKQIIATVITVATMVMTAIPAFADTTYANGGRWTDKENLVWTYNDGSTLAVGRGSVFSNVNSGITDPEYYVKKFLCYPGEAAGILNDEGTPKSDYGTEAREAVQNFVNSFDWINSDELTRATKIWERIAHHETSNSNSYGSPDRSYRFPVLMNGRGVCEQFSEEFAFLAKCVGLECVQYDHSYNHAACILKINNQWIVIDPTNATSLYDNTNHPVDYETEYNRYSNGVKNSEWYQNQMQEVEWQKQAEAGIITWREYFQKIYPDKTLAEIEQIIGMDMDSYEQLWKE